mmetsp:Transcript_16848/g.32924  ORF Transcript_16848/g.32924 Transcript_16848/m.32924 type:complete len:535 (-) Transcript_16848:350-1954(-)
MISTKALGLPLAFCVLALWTTEVSGLADDDIHIVFSTDCGGYQNWQAMALSYSALMVGQKGHITRIVSNCPDDADFAMMRRSSYPNYHLHITPTFSLDEGREYFPYYNKPLGVDHWIKNAVPAVTQSVVVLLDPDMVFVQPIRPDGVRDKNNILYTGRRQKSEVTDAVSLGHPVGQQYLIGSGWVTFKRDLICGAGSPCTTVDHGTAIEHYSLGPPYLLHREDAKKVFDAWAKYVIKVREVEGKKVADMLSEMFAYCLGAAHHELPHERLDHFMVSNHRAEGEGWTFIDNLEEKSGHNPCLGTHHPPQDAALPLLVHYPGEVIPIIDPAKGGWKFHKKHMPHNIYDCKAKVPGWTSDDANGPITTTPEEIWQKATAPDAKCAHQHSGMDCKRQAWVACQVHKTIQESILEYKKKYCAPGYNDQMDGALLHPVVMGAKVDPYGAPLSGAKQTREGLKPEYKNEDGSKAYHIELQKKEAAQQSAGVSSTIDDPGSFSAAVDDSEDNTAAYLVVLLPAVCGICLILYRAVGGKGKEN